MVEPIHPFSKRPEHEHEPVLKVTPTVAILADEMKTQASSFASHLQMLLEDPTLGIQASFLKKFADNVTHLHKTVHQVLSMRS